MWRGEGLGYNGRTGRITTSLWHWSLAAVGTRPSTLSLPSLPSTYPSFPTPILPTHPSCTSLTFCCVPDEQLRDLAQYKLFLRYDVVVGRVRGANARCGPAQHGQAERRGEGGGQGLGLWDECLLWPIAA